MREPRDRFLISQFPPCSRGGTVRAASLATRSYRAPFKEPRTAFFGLGKLASGGTRLGFVATSSDSRLFHLASKSAEGAQPIRPGCVRPAKRTPGMWRDVA